MSQRFSGKASFTSALVGQDIIRSIRRRKREQDALRYLKINFPETFVKLMKSKAGYRIMGFSLNTTQGRPCRKGRPARS